MIEIYGVGGRMLGIASAPGVGATQLSVDHQGQLWAPCPRTGDIKVFGADGRPSGRIPTGGVLSPAAIDVDETGAAWVCGQAE
jgi:streptogramin lyase